MHKVLLWKVGALGDVVMTTPLLRQLRQQLPRARIDYLVGRSFAAVLDGSPHVDQVRVFDESILYRGRLLQVPQVLDLLRGYDAVFILDKHWIFPLLASLAGVPRRIGFRRRQCEGALLTHAVPYGALRHEIAYYLDLLTAAGLHADHGDVRMEPPAAAACALPAGCTILINSGGANANEDSRVRRMPDALFKALAQACAAQGPVAFLGAASEAGYYQSLAPTGSINLCGRTSLPQAVSALRQAAQVISTDTGLMHLGAAVSPRVTAVFGPTHPARKCPPGARAVWADADRYNETYELFGRLPRGRYFDRLNVEEILCCAQQDGGLAR